MATPSTSPISTTDGVRVVQEVGWKGVPARVEISGDPAKTYYLPRRANEMHWEPAGGGSGSSTQTCGPTGPSDWSWSDRRLEREYVWAADPGGYVDECIAQLVYTDAHAVNGSNQVIGDDTAAIALYLRHLEYEPLLKHGATKPVGQPRVRSKTQLWIRSASLFPTIGCTFSALVPTYAPKPPGIPRFPHQIQVYSPPNLTQPRGQRPQR